MVYAKLTDGTPPYYAQVTSSGSTLHCRCPMGFNCPYPLTHTGKRTHTYRKAHRQLQCTRGTWSASSEILPDTTESVRVRVQAGEPRIFFGKLVGCLSCLGGGGGLHNLCTVKYSKYYALGSRSQPTRSGFRRSGDSDSDSRTQAVDPQGRGC